MIIFGVIGKLGALFVTIPSPVIGGVLMVMFGRLHNNIKHNINKHLHNNSWIWFGYTFLNQSKF